MTPYARKEGLLIQDIGDEVVVYDQERDRVHSLNPTTALVWRHCDGATSIAAMAELLARDLGLPADEEVVRLALEQLGKAHLLQEPVARPADAIRVNRRQLIRNLGLAGGFSLLAPAIESIVAPTPAMANTPVENPCADAGFLCGSASECELIGGTFSGKKCPNPFHECCEPPNPIP